MHYTFVTHITCHLPQCQPSCPPLTSGKSQILSLCQTGQENIWTQVLSELHTFVCCIWPRNIYCIGLCARCLHRTMTMCVRTAVSGASGRIGSDAVLIFADGGAAVVAVTAVGLTRPPGREADAQLPCSHRAAGRIARPPISGFGRCVAQNITCLPVTAITTQTLRQNWMHSCMCSVQLSTCCM